MSSYIPLKLDLGNRDYEDVREEERDLVDSFSDIIRPSRTRPGIRISTPDDHGYEDQDAGSRRPNSTSAWSRRSKFHESVEDLTDLSRTETLRSLEGNRPSLLAPVGEYSSTYGNAADVADQYAHVPEYCHSKKDVAVSRRTWAFIFPMVSCVISTILSTVYCVATTFGFKYGNMISYDPSAIMTPETAQLVSTVTARFIELTFAIVVVFIIGQSLSKRAFATGSTGISISEITMRTWIAQPGNILLHSNTFKRSLRTKLGWMALFSALFSVAYTAASNALVSPIIATTGSTDKLLKGMVTGTYANVYIVRDSCSTPIGEPLDEKENAEGSCLDVQYSGLSYRNLMNFMKDWARIGDNPSMANDTLLDFRKRPTGKHNLYDNTTMTSTWLEAEFGDIKKNWDEHDRIVHQVRLAMPHPGVYAAVNDQQNNIPLLTNPNGLGLVNITASVVSPTVDVLCANLNRTELRPLVYTSWPHARTQDTKVPGQKIGLDDWEKDVPPPDEKDWLNTTVVDDIFKWGSKYGRWPPAFPLYPNDWNMIVNDTTSALNQNQVGASGSLYILGKSGLGDDYTLCQMRSWVSPVCSTRFQIIGNSGVHMDTLCDDPQGEESDSYWRYIKDHSGDDIPDMQVSQDWQNLAVQWRTSMDINGGVYNNNASNARIMTHLALQKPELPASLPSLSEALAVYVSPTLVLGSIRSPFAHYWDHDNYNATNTPAPIAVDFGATMQVYEYASTSVVDAGGFIFFYIVLLGVMLINIYCFYLLVWGGGVVVTDYTDPANNFALAINSPPSSVMAGSCGGGPEKDQTTAPFRIVYASGANHYYFLEAQDRFKSRHSALSTGSRKLLLSEALYEKSYKRLSSRKPIM